MSNVINVLSRFKSKLGPSILYARSLSNLSKDLTRQPTSNNQDILMTNLKDATCSGTILDIISKHHNIMNSRHILQALKSLLASYRTPNAYQMMPMKKLLKHPDFEKLCNKLRTQIGIIDIPETIDSLKVLCFIGVPCHSAIVQALLQILRHNINELELSEIVFVTYLLKQFNGTTPLIDALKIAMPIVFEIQLNTKMDKNNIAHVADSLYYAVREGLGNKAIETIVAAAMLSTREFDVKTAVSFIWSICDLPADVYYEPIVTKSLNVLISKIDEMNYNDMETTLTKLINRYNAKTPFYYNEEFFNCCCNYVMDKNLGIEIALYISRKLLKIAYVNNYLLDYMSKEICKDPKIILSGDPIFAYMTANYFASTDYRTKDFDTLKKLLENTTVFDDCTNKRDIMWLKLNCALIRLDIYKPDIIRKGFEEAINSNRKFHSLDIYNVVALTSAVTVLNPQYRNLLPDQSIPSRFMMRSPSEFPLESFLQRGLGGENYVRTDCKSKEGIKIDHVIAMRPGGYNVALNINEEKYLEDIILPEDSQMLLIYLLRPYHLTINCLRVIASMSILLKSLEAKGYAVLTINQDLWDNLQEFEKIPYLMQSIKSKMVTSNEVLSANV